MRIAFYAPMKPPDHPVPSGDRTIGRLIAAALERAGHEVRVASGFRSWAATPEAQVELRGQAEAARAAALADMREWRPRAWLTYHAYYKAPDWLGPEIARALDIPYLIAEASYAPRRAGEGWRQGMADTEQALAAAAAVLILKRRDRPALQTLGLGSKLIRLPPFVDETAWPARPRHAHGGPLRLLAVGMMRDGVKRESYHHLAEALALVTAPWCLTVAGTGPLQTDIAQMFGRYGENARLTGLLTADELREVYYDADLLIWPGLGEAVGMTYLEAQATGLPVAAYGAAGAADVIVNGRTGVLTPPDPAALARAVDDLAADGPRRAAFGIAAAAHVRAVHGLAAASVVLDAALRRAAAEAGR